uniref:Uncharacterized protein n=1 Tax=Rhizophora mucronata TaxID=61149 RepID=A0A2P2QMA3_RHIMU
MMWRMRRRRTRRGSGWPKRCWRSFKPLRREKKRRRMKKKVKDCMRRKERGILWLPRCCWSSNLWTVAD